MRRALVEPSCGAIGSVSWKSQLLRVGGAADQSNAKLAINTEAPAMVIEATRLSALKTDSRAADTSAISIENMTANAVVTNTTPAALAGASKSNASTMSQRITRLEPVMPIANMVKTRDANRIRENREYKQVLMKGATATA